MVSARPKRCCFGLLMARGLPLAALGGALMAAGLLLAARGLSFAAGRTVRGGVAGWLALVF